MNGHERHKQNRDNVIIKKLFDDMIITTVAKGLNNFVNGIRSTSFRAK